MIGGAAVISFARLHGTNHRQMVHLGGDARQMLADTNARDGALDRREWAAVGMSGLEIEGVCLAWTAAHPKQYAGTDTARIGRDLSSDLREQTRHAQSAAQTVPKRVAAGEANADGRKCLRH